VRYFATEPAGCFGECLARFRPDPKVLAAVKDDAGFMDAGSVPAEWRQRRLLAQVVFPEGWEFLDVNALETRETLRVELAEVLAFYGYNDLDIAVVRGADRRVTRFISQWTWHQALEDGSPRYAGIRYTSRLEDSWELWAAFDDVPVDVLSMRSISREDPDLLAVAKEFGLIVH
jgi:hypothetical protein